MNDQLHFYMDKEMPSWSYGPPVKTPAHSVM